METVRALLQEKITSLEAAVSSRDYEISRLHKNFDQGNNIDKITSDYTDKTKQEKIDFLNGQVDFLNKQNFDLENTVKELNSKVQRSSGLFGENDRLLRKTQTLTTNVAELKTLIKRQENQIERGKNEVPVSPDLSFLEAF